MISFNFTTSLSFYLYFLFCLVIFVLGENNFSVLYPHFIKGPPYNFGNKMIGVN